jgi:hypothetical protein
MVLLHSLLWYAAQKTQTDMAYRTLVRRTVLWQSNVHVLHLLHSIALCVFCQGRVA